MHSVLIVDDEDAIRKGLREYAEFMGYEVSEAADGMEAVELCRSRDFDVVIMDVMMPKLDGFTACKEIKKVKDVPVMILSARSEEYDKLFGFAMGIDDYVTKPFSAKEVMARIGVIVNRNRKLAQEASEERNLLFGGLEIDMAGRNVKVDGKKAELTPKEYELLFFMVKNKNLALSREKLLNAVWGYEFCGDYRTVDTHIKTLRMGLGAYKDKIVTLRGMGYKFEA
ncbi:MAG: response regulator transcription factor [Clostridiales bacterium]|nr:response regulator transcription factor [Clostridiales bacterium]